VTDEKVWNGDSKPAYPNPADFSQHMKKYLISLFNCTNNEFFLCVSRLAVPEESAQFDLQLIKIDVKNRCYE
jgi:hypothetical protein